MLIGGLCGVIASAGSAIATPGSTPPPEAGQHRGPSGAANADLNGDGYGDLAVSAPYSTVRDNDSAGRVYAFLGTATGLPSRGSQVLTNATRGVPGTVSQAQGFGLELTWGDFDADGYDDLAVSAPFSDVKGHDTTGTVTIIPGSPVGLTGENSVRWSLYSKEMPGGHRDGGWGQFGTTVVSADLDADGFDDLVIGVPDGVIGNYMDGTARVLYGSAGGLGAGRDGSVIRPRKDSGANSDYFGIAMAVGDFDGDGYPDVAVGAPERPVGMKTSAGQVLIFGGGNDGLTKRPTQSWNARSPGLVDPPASLESWGSVLAAGDLDGDRIDDLAASAPSPRSGESKHIDGYVRVLFGTSDGLTGAGSQLWDKETPGLPIEPAPTNGFGGELLIADITGDGLGDLVLTHTADVVDGEYGGSFFVLPGSAVGPIVEGVERWNQNSPGISDDAEYLEYFGAELAASDVNGDARLDIITSTPGESIAEVDDAGLVQTFIRSDDGTIFDEDWPISRSSPGVRGDPKNNDSFGARLAG